MSRVETIKKDGLELISYEPQPYPEGQFVVVWTWNNELWSEVYRDIGNGLEYWNETIKDFDKVFYPKDLTFISNPESVIKIIAKV